MAKSLHQLSRNVQFYQDLRYRLQSLHSHLSSPNEDHSTGVTSLTEIINEMCSLYEGILLPYYAKCMRERMRRWMSGLRAKSHVKSDASSQPAEFTLLPGRYHSYTHGAPNGHEFLFFNFLKGGLQFQIEYLGGAVTYPHVWHGKRIAPKKFRLEPPGLSATTGTLIGDSEVNLSQTEWLPSGITWKHESSSNTLSTSGDSWHTTDFPKTNEDALDKNQALFSALRVLCPQKGRRGLCKMAALSGS